MNDPAQERQDDYLSELDTLATEYQYSANLSDYDRMTVAYGRGLCTPGELSQWLARYEFNAARPFGWQGWLRYAVQSSARMEVAR